MLVIDGNHGMRPEGDEPLRLLRGLEERWGRGNLLARMRSSVERSGSDEERRFAMMDAEQLRARRVQSEEQPPEMPVDVVVILDGRLVDDWALFS